MGRKFIVEEVEEKSGFGCGSTVAMIIIVLIIGACGGFKSCKEDKKPKPIETRTVQPQSTDAAKVKLPPYVPKSSPSSSSKPASTITQKPQKETEVEPVTEINSDQDIGTEEPVIPTIAIEQEDNIISETDSEVPALTEKERRKAERQAKREARRREKAQKNN